jgi:hypothetical protein
MVEGVGAARGILDAGAALALLERYARWTQAA